MGLFSHRRARRVVELAIPGSSRVGPADLDHLLRSWAIGSRDARGPVPLPAGLCWSGPQVGVDEVEGDAVYTLTWEHADSTPAQDASSIAGTEWDAAITLAGWLYDSARRDDEPDVGGPRAYAVAVMSGLARRTDGQIRVAGGRWTRPGDPEATWTVYSTERPSAESVATALHELAPGLSLAAVELPTWVLEAPDGLGLWLEEIGIDGVQSWEAIGDASHAALAAVQRLHATTLWAVRIEGATDTADAAGRARLDDLATCLADALHGVACDAEGFPVGS
jgi:hypothetical protein